MTSSAEFDPDCAFCEIARAKAPSVDVVCEDDTWVAFFPLEPATPGHTLVIPRRHVSDLWHLDAQLSADLMASVIRVGRAINRALDPEGMNLITSAGVAAEQSVFHVHLHVVPRWQRDGFGRIWPTGSKFEDVAVDQVADRIRQACSQTEQ